MGQGIALEVDVSALAYKARLGTPTGTRPRATRVAGIDAIRGLACVWVLLHHSYSDWQWRCRLPVLWHVNAVAADGFLGVHLFLVISGFVLFYPVVRRTGTREARVDVVPFMRRRARRILPPYYAALVLFWTLRACTTTNKWGGLTTAGAVGDDLLHLTMLFNLNPRMLSSFNGSFWSLALEFQLYLCFPLLLWACRRIGVAGMLAGTLAAAVAWQVVAVPRLMPPLASMPAKFGWSYQATWYYALPGRCFEFAAGMAAAAVVARPRRGRAVIAAAAVLLVGPVAARLVSTGGQFGPARDQLWGVAFAALLVLTADAPGWLVRSSPVRLAGWVGGISFSVYLLHQPLLEISGDALVRYGVWPTHRLPLFLFGALPILVAVGYAFHRLVERPFMTAPARQVQPGGSGPKDAPTPNPLSFRRAA